MEERKDVVIIGAGPAGIQAAIHSVRKKCDVLLLGRIERSALFSAHVENYACVEGVKTGEELLVAGMDQVQRFGASVMEDDVLKVQQDDDGFVVELESGVTILTRTLIFANGTSRKNSRFLEKKNSLEEASHTVWTAMLIFLEILRWLLSVTLVLPLMGHSL